MTSVGQISSSQFLTNTQIELARCDVPHERFRAVVFDFDGTLSLIRGGWADVMVEMMMPILRAAGAREADAELRQVVTEFVLRLNGRPPIYQMMHLADEVRQRGGAARDPREDECEFTARLQERMSPRIQQLRADPTARERLTVPDTHRLLARLREKGVSLHLASGTKWSAVCEETKLLGIAEFFGERIYAPRGDPQDFSKRDAIAQLLRTDSLRGEELLGFGDGTVEIEEIKRVGGVAVGVACDETHCVGMDTDKRARLLAAGADIIVADYREQDVLLQFLFEDNK